MSQLTSLFFQLFFGSARLRALAAGLLIGAVAYALGQRNDAGLLPPTMAAAVVFAGAASVLCLTLERAPRRDAATLWRLTRQALLCLGSGVLLAMHGLGWLA